MLTNIHGDRSSNNLLDGFGGVYDTDVMVLDIGGTK